jgi:hypothetical protein
MPSLFKPILGSLGNFRVIVGAIREELGAEQWGHLSCERFVISVGW